MAFGEDATPRRGLVATTTATIIAASIAAAGTATAATVAAKSQKGAAKRAADAEMSALDKQLEFERETEAERKAEWDRAQEEAKTQWEAEQAEETRRFELNREDTIGFAREKYANRERQMAPYRAVGAGALSQLAQLAGVAPAGPAPMSAPAAAAVASAPPVAAEPAPEDVAAHPYLSDPNILPPTLGPGSGGIVPAPVGSATPAASETPTMAQEAYARLGPTLASAPTALTPEQVAALTKRAYDDRRWRSSLGDLARSRRAAV